MNRRGHGCGLARDPDLAIAVFDLDLGQARGVKHFGKLADEIDVHPHLVIMFLGHATLSLSIGAVCQNRAAASSARM